MIFKTVCNHDCEFLEPKEKDQSSKKAPHWCNRYNKELRHNGNHPYLEPCWECFDYEREWVTNGNAPTGRIINIQIIKGEEITGIGVLRLSEIIEYEPSPKFNFLKEALTNSVSIELKPASIKPKFLNFIAGRDMFKDKPNNWRKMHGLRMRRKGRKKDEQN